MYPQFLKNPHFMRLLVPVVPVSYTHLEQIATMMHHTHKTIQNYLNPDYSIINGHYHVRIPGKLAPYEKDVIELRSKGLTYPQICLLYTSRCV